MSQVTDNQELLIKSLITNVKIKSYFCVTHQVADNQCLLLKAPYVLYICARCEMLQCGIAGKSFNLLFTHSTLKDKKTGFFCNLFKINTLMSKSKVTVNW
jgi:hypothetical protein